MWLLSLLQQLLALIVTRVAPVFLVVSPLTSYTDQIWSIHKTKSSRGFALDIPLILLCASILRIFYWAGARFDVSLLMQAIIMIAVQTVLLKVALDNRPSPGARGTLETTPFAATPSKETFSILETRPYDFWRWRSPKPYWTFISYFTFTCLAIHILAGRYSSYIQTIGFLALAVESLVPFPQMLSNYQSKSCKGFRVSVLCSWLLGDVLKMIFFFFAETPIPRIFKLCGVFAFMCDLYLGYQYLEYGDGSLDGREMTEIRTS